MGVLWSLLKRPLFLLDPEFAHRCAVKCIRVCIRAGFFKSQSVRVRGATNFRCAIAACRSPVGLAAGFDKDCEILEALPSLGFGFAEIGTVTPRPQSGNSGQRLFRDAKAETLFNRMGFNSAGAAVVAERLRQVRPRLPDHFLVGVNLGKNKETPLEESFRDYGIAVKFFEGLADYLVINVSSPNTPQLRSLQTVEGLQPILAEVRAVMSGWVNSPPLFLKIGPELHGEQLGRLMNAMDSQVEGWIFTNTLGGFLEYRGKKLAGGWSGKTLADLSRLVLIQARPLTSKVIISVGGIDSLQIAAERLELGADLVQIYTGWIYQGPQFPYFLAQKLARLKFAKKKPQAEA